MNIEQEIFKRSIIIYDKLIKYGFIKEDNYYILEKNILNDTFKIIIKITLDNKVIGKIYDLSFDEEYTNYRIKDNMGEFINNIREMFIDTLIDIKNKCCKEFHFIHEQSNRLSSLIYDKYKTNPEFLWEDTPGAGVFRNKATNKWYGIIMNVNKSKITEGNEEVEVLNVKLDKDKIIDLLKRAGFYKAYHMNKIHWISIILDNTISDKEIMSLIDESYEFSSKK